MPPLPAKEYCQRCHTWYKDWDTYHSHLIESDRHHACYVCAQEFHNQGALDSHYKQNHAHKQDLRCVKCFRRFTTLGGLTAHIEFDDGCYGGLNLTAKVHETTTRDRKMGAARDYKGGRSGGNDNVPEDEPRPALRDWSKVAPPERSLRHMSGNAAQPPTITKPNGPVVPRKAPTIIVPDEEEDLMSCDDPSKIMNAPWDDCIPPSFNEAYPPLTSYKNPMSTPNIIDAPAAIPTVWINHRAPAPAPILPTADQLADNMNTWRIDRSDEPVMSPWDPENPAFSADRYLNDFTKAYRCPYPGCKKHSIQNKSAFIQHLKSAAHKNERLQCHGCLRYFDSATALAQHASAQGVRCRVRESDNYDNEVDRFTAGHAAPDGRFDDDTIKYVTTGMPQTAQGLVDAHKAAIAERAEQTKNYWNKHEPRW